MTNFLNRMAVRAMGTIATAKPFVPSVFTPASGRAGNTTSSSSFFDPTIQGVGRDRDRARQADATESTGDATSPSGREALNSTLTSNSAADSSLAEPLSTLDSTSERLDRLPPTSSLSKEPAIAALRTRRHLQPEETSAYTPDHSIAKSPESDQTHRGENDQLIANMAQRPAISPALWNDARVQASTRPLDSPRDVRSPTPEAPIIRVSIGRIDVRAEFSTAMPSPAPVRNARPATLSLDEYLKQRSEGRR